MKLLISCVNSPQSLIGYDLSSREVFWQVPASTLKSCGISYFHNSLLVASDNQLVTLSEQGRSAITLQGPYAPLAHSVHPISNESYGVVDTGHSALRIYDTQGKLLQALNPVSSWGELPQDAIHLNDFVSTPFGIFASCFDYRPWRESRGEKTFREWCSGGYGLILNLSGHTKNNNKESGIGRVVMCGLNHPHSLCLHNESLYCCSSATGEFHKAAFLADGTLRETARIKITEKHFLRGALPQEFGWILGGSSSRHGEKMSESIALYLFNEESSEIEEVPIPLPGEIYDILPWREEVMSGATKLL